MTYDVVSIGGGAAGEAVGSLGGELGAKVAVVEDELVGGECSFWACMPSKTLLDSAARRFAGADYPWDKASARRDWMISREGIDYPDDSLHVSRLEEVGTRVVKGRARITGPGRLEVTRKGELPVTIEARNIVVATGSVPVIPQIPGLAGSGFWTNREATSTRELPSSLVILGGGPMGVEAAQFFVRFGVKVVLIDSHDRILPRDHPRNSAAVFKQLQEEGVDIRLGQRAVEVKEAGGVFGVKLSGGDSAAGDRLIVAVGRSRNLDGLGLEEAGVEVPEDGPVPRDDQMRMGEGVFVAGDAAGGLQFTHLADYEGRIALRAALGQPVKADHGSVPRATYTDPETGAVGLTVEEAQAAGIDAFEVTADFAQTSRGMTIEGAHGHLTAVFDRGRRIMVGAFAACKGASELIHGPVLAIKQQTPLEVLADTIHAFPTGARAFSNLYAEALKQI